MRYTRSCVNVIAVVDSLVHGMRPFRRLSRYLDYSLLVTPYFAGALNLHTVQHFKIFSQFHSYHVLSEGSSDEVSAS